MEMLLTALYGIGSAFILGAFKKYTGALDTRIGSFIKPVQPVVVAGLSIALPAVANALHLQNLPTADIIAQAPTAAIIGIVAREIAGRIAPKPTQQ